ncbi:metal ABC transporter solute-binding protein, Zn/Mn family [Aquibacillus saliphilus]|uniref:metal ABC transporter solute-binding protein, Zn/Mn family n=1 Tax=Aquibacillus saliphilus TaxID=1909422 RepID=UPI001CEFCD0E|nr:zinc ABC transporter substrate-binding protein [Aquibacillus saliphilus]
MRKKLLVLSFILLILMLIGCSSESAQSDTKADDDVLKIYTTLYPIEDFVNKIGGSHVEVTSILPAGGDPHTYEPTSKTLVEIASADLFLYNGAGLEAYADKIIGAIADEDTVIVEAAQGVSLLDHVHEDEKNDSHEEADHTDEDDHEHAEEENHEEDEEDNHNHGDVDPHVWLDPIRAITLAENITEALVAANPDLQTEFQENFEQLKLKLLELDEEFHNKVEAKEQNKILVSHSAYGYWEKAYGIEQIAITGLSPSNEPSHKQLEKVIEKVKGNNIKYILFEQNVAPKVAEVIQNEVSVEPLEIHNLSVLTEEDIENKEDYFSLMNRNIEVLVKALSSN